MTKQDTVQIFEDKKVRTVWDDEMGTWFFSVIDVIEILTNTDRPRKYWNDLKTKLKREGSELSDFIGQLKMKASDGKPTKPMLLTQSSFYINTIHGSRKSALNDWTRYKIRNSPLTGLWNNI